MLPLLLALVGPAALPTIDGPTGIDINTTGQVASSSPAPETFTVSAFTPKPFLPGMATLGGRAWFTATSPTTGTELYSTGGQPGDVQLLDLWPGLESSGPRRLASHAGRLWFLAADPDHGLELWSSDGTVAGTAMVRDIEPGPDSSDLGIFSERILGMGAEVYFNVQPPGGSHGL